MSIYLENIKTLVLPIPLSSFEKLCRLSATHNITPTEYAIYLLCEDIDAMVEEAEFLAQMKILQAQEFDEKNIIPPAQAKAVMVAYEQVMSDIDELSATIPGGKSHQVVGESEEKSREIEQALIVKQSDLGTKGA